MADYSDLRAYDDMIAELKSFCKNVSDASAGMKAQGSACVQVMNDTVSMNALKRIVKTIKNYESAVGKAQDLIKTLEAEKEEIEEIIRKSKEMGEEE